MLGWLKYLICVRIANNTLTRVFRAVKFTDKMRLVGTYHGQRMYVFGFVRSGQRDKTKGNRAGVVRPAGRFDNGGFVPS